MPLTFVCEECTKRFFFQSYVLNDARKLCRICDNNLRFRQRRLEIEEQTELRKAQRRKTNELHANDMLRKQLELESLRQKEKHQRALEKRVQNRDSLDEQSDDLPQKQRIISLEKQALDASKKFDRVLYVFVDVKHLKAIEWMHGKKRLLLNKEREIRRTHKGGYSQEKFQKFVEMKKRMTSKWVEENLLRPGVLRGPYEMLFIDTSSEELKEAISAAIKERAA